MIGLLLFLQFPSDIVVTGQRLREVQAECAKGGCTPLRDAQATIALAEVDFRDGAYLAAKRLLAAAAARNKRHAAEAPRAVAAIYEAYATVALHDGDRNNYQRAVRNQVQTLRNYLPANDVANISASTALGDMWMKIDNYRQAEITFRGVETSSLTAGQDRTAMLAGMKRIWLLNAMGRNQEVAAKLAELERRPLAQQPGFRTALQVLRLRIAARKADGKEIDKMLAAIGPQGPDPVLILSPTYEKSVTEAVNAIAGKFDLTTAVQRTGSDFDPTAWADIGFWIRPDGQTDDVEILRGSTNAQWAAPALAQIAARRYSPVVDESEAGQGRYRVERFTRRSAYSQGNGSLIRRRYAIGGYEVLDLTGPPAALPKDEAAPDASHPIQ